MTFLVELGTALSEELVVLDIGNGVSSNPSSVSVLVNIESSLFTLSNWGSKKLGISDSIGTLLLPPDTEFCLSKATEFATCCVRMVKVDVFSLTSFWPTSMLSFTSSSSLDLNVSICALDIPKIIGTTDDDCSICLTSNPTVCTTLLVFVGICVESSVLLPPAVSVPCPTTVTRKYNIAIPFEYIFN